jgi:cytochrome c peroxidase
LRSLASLLAASLIMASTLVGTAWGSDEPQLRAGWRDDYRRPAVIPYPADNSYSAEKAALGATLFFDPVLSGSRNSACVTCHQPTLAWGDGLPRAIGDRQKAIDLRSPTLLDVAWIPRLGWDGKFPDIESVSFRAIFSEGNMDLPVQEALERLSANPAYVRRFQAAFGPGRVTQEKVEQALATYERGIVSSPAPFDHWVAGDEGAVGDAAKRGFALFDGKAGCSGCHSGWSFTNHSFQDIGSAVGNDLGRGALFPSSISLRYAFKVPTLRDTALRAPFMHDGSIATLAAVIELYDRGGIARPSRSPQIRPLGLTPVEKAELIEFLATLTGDSQKVVAPLSPR